MDKAQLVEKLNEKGYQAMIEDDIPKVVITVKNISEIKHREKEIKELIEEFGYTCSYGWKVRYEK